MNDKRSDLSQSRMETYLYCDLKKTLELAREKIYIIKECEISIKKLLILSGIKRKMFILFNK